MRTIQADVVVRLDPNLNSRKKNLEDLPEFDAVAWCRLCERAYQHTLLVDRISEQIKQNPDVLNWIRAMQEDEVQASAATDEDEGTDTQQGYNWLPDKLVNELCSCLKETPQFKGMSGRTYTSATKRVEKIFKGWFASHRKLIKRISGKRRWLTVVESDSELAENSNFNQLDIENQAQQILVQIEAETESGDESEDRNRKDRNRKIFDLLFEKFDATKDVLTRRAIIHLLKNDGKVRWEPKKPRNSKKSKQPSKPMPLEERLAAKRVEIDRLEKQLLKVYPSV